ncbi:uncharacterized protein BT62DRAFT_729195 [Guyanagaster necrorhizus]|uniref:Secreted protein n=1 Tax=Guyanagaster necrorhizus TaxID=856835 RepID=A0A9P7VXL1_9AGAR|nr:uncharacterized protein BT62DRAFT_729195 [Guyanagaster necrorhizus MCA 3950]KAG7448809.1 hypothetical protein BT62DRAFT_729195 [Guyanagaster necrorhizus MCA 3950]
MVFSLFLTLLCIFFISRIAQFRRNLKVDHCVFFYDTWGPSVRNTRQQSRFQDFRPIFHRLRLPRAFFQTSWWKLTLGEVI